MIDDAKLIEDGTSLHADICVVGGGTAGITLALEFLRHDRSVLVVESGAFASDEATQSLYEGDVVDEALHSPLHTYRQRRFGGSTTVWGGRCVPLDPIDFEQRPYMPASGWPFGYETLLPYYFRANELCEAGEFAYSVRSAFPQGMRPTFFDRRFLRGASDRRPQGAAPPARGVAGRDLRTGSTVGGA